MTTIWIADQSKAGLAAAGLRTFEQIMSTTAGTCLRALSDRENWYLPGTPRILEQIADNRYSVLGTRYSVLSTRIAADGPRVSDSAQVSSHNLPPGMYLKKHLEHSGRTRLAAALGLAAPSSPGRIEAENAVALQSLGIDVMPLTAYGEKLHADGRLESFLLSEELQGYCELQEFIQWRFRADGTRSVPASLLRRLIVQVAEIARRFHTAGFNHRDFYCCHFLVKETAPCRFDVRLIDLQRVQQRRWFRRRWIVKDLAQLASMSPDEQIGCREKVLFLRTYLGVKKLRPQDKRLVRAVLRKLASIRRHINTKPRRGGDYRTNHT
jgi:heptose I phosphotransferase